MKKSSQLSLLDAAAAVISGAEKELRQLAATAASEGRYDDLVSISQWAKVLQGLAGGLGVPASEMRSESRAKAQGLVGAGDLEFRRDNNVLVKITRSKRSGKGYEHRVPTDVLDRVTDYLSRWKSSKKLLTVEQILEAHRTGGGESAAYQVYVVLGWLISLDLVRRHGRSGYSVPDPSLIVPKSQSAFAQMASV